MPTDEEACRADLYRILLALCDPVGFSFKSLRLIVEFWIEEICTGEVRSTPASESVDLPSENWDMLFMNIRFLTCFNPVRCLSAAHCLTLSAFLF